MFPFGFGLTYSKTEIKKLTLNKEKLKSKDELKVQVEVSNTGNFDIDEVVQLYVSPIENSENLPQTSLKGFQRISLKIGETKTVNFSITGNELEVVNSNGEKVWRKGAYKVIVGNSSPSVLSEKLGAAKPQSAIIKLK